MRSGFFALFACAMLTRGSTYYVDATLGQDSNVGISATAPWKTLAKVNSTTLNPGDRVFSRLANSGLVSSPQGLQAQGKALCRSTAMVKVRNRRSMVPAK